VFGANPKDMTQKILALADVRVDGACPWDLTVYNEDFYARLLRLGSLGLGETYIDGWWDCRALDEFFCRIFFRWARTTRSPQLAMCLAVSISKRL
jgi:hypothetical protein